MSSSFVTLIPIAIVVGFSPIPIVQLILVIFSKRRIPNLVAFVGTLIVMTAAVVAFGVAGYDAAEEADDQTRGVVSLALVVAGAFLIAMGVRYWRDRADTSEPKVFEKITDMGPGAAALLAVAAVFANPKNLVLLLAAGQTIGAADADSDVMAAVVFVALATAPYVFTAVYALAGGESAQTKLDGFRAWLMQRNRAIMGVISTVVGAYLVIKGISAF